MRPSAVSPCVCVWVCMSGRGDREAECGSRAEPSRTKPAAAGRDLERERGKGDGGAAVQQWGRCSREPYEYPPQHRGGCTGVWGPEGAEGGGEGKVAERVAHPPTLRLCERRRGTSRRTGDWHGGHSKRFWACRGAHFACLHPPSLFSPSTAQGPTSPKGGGVLQDRWSV